MVELRIEFDATKDASNIAKHGISLAAAKFLDWETAEIWPDKRKDYGEPRQIALAMLNKRIYYVVFVERRDMRRIISLRKANKREVKYYETRNNQTT